MSYHAPLVLGLPWLQLHNPHIDWVNKRVLEWSASCLSSCLRSAVEGSPSSQLEDCPNLSNVLTEYHDLWKVFSKSRADSQPPHRPYDCAINLLPDITPPKGQLYSLFHPKREGMNQYIAESLAAGMIRSLSSPAGAGFFFMKKKDKSLWRCIDYRGLNKITIKNFYPLPLMTSAFELLQGARIFTKLDL